MEWTVAAPWLDFENQHDQDMWWIVPHINARGKHKLHFVPRSQPLLKWHERKSKYTSLSEWKIYWEHAQRALKESNGGVITGFPQLPPLLSLQQKLSFKKKPVVACIFTIGNCTPGIRQWLAQASLGDIDRFTVPTRQEQRIYSDYLNLPIERFEFIQYHVPPIEVKYEEETQKPFILAMGSAHRDFSTFFQAVSSLKVPTTITSGKPALECLEIPGNVEIPENVSRDDCFRLAQQACINVIPMIPKPDTTAGIVTIVEAMRMGRPVIVSKCNGAEDYVIHGETGWLVEPNSLADLQDAIKTLWNDEGLRQKLGLAAKEYADSHFSDEAGAQSVEMVLDDVIASGKY